MPLSFTLGKTKYSVGIRPSAVALLMWGANLFFRSAAAATSVIVEITSPTNANNTGVVQFDSIDPQIVDTFESAANKTLGAVTEIISIPANFSALKAVCKIDGPQQVWVSFCQFVNASFKAGVIDLAEQSCISERNLQSFIGWKAFTSGSGYITGVTMASVFMLAIAPQRLNKMGQHYLITFGLEAMSLLAVIIPLSNASRMEIVPSAVVGFVAGGLITSSIGALMDKGPEVVKWIKSSVPNCTFFTQSLKAQQTQLIAATPAAADSQIRSEEYQTNL